MKKKIDVFVLNIMILFTLVNLIISSIEPSIGNHLLLKGLNLVPYAGSVIVLIKFSRDFNYSFNYFISAVVITYVLRLLLSAIVYNYFKELNLYSQIFIFGAINAFLYAYFYQLFKELSYKRMEKA